MFSKEPYYRTTHSYRDRQGRVCFKTERYHRTYEQAVDEIKEYSDTVREPVEIIEIHDRIEDNNDYYGVRLVAYIFSVEGCLWMDRDTKYDRPWVIEKITPK